MSGSRKADDYAARCARLLEVARREPELTHRVLARRFGLKPQTVAKVLREAGVAAGELSKSRRLWP